MLSSRNASDDRQGVDALGQVLAGRLAELLLVRHHVEHVVAQLEEHPEAPPELAEHVDLGRGAAARDGPDATGRGHECGRLAFDGAEVVVLGPSRVEGGPDLGHLALAQPPERVGQEGGDLGPERGGDLGRAGEEEVSGHDGHEVAEAGVDALHVAADQGLVHDVVVIERGQVDELHRTGPSQVVGGRRPPAPGGGGQGQARAQALAPRRDQVGGDLVQEAVARAHGLAELGLEAAQVITEGRQAQQGSGVHQGER